MSHQTSDTATGDGSGGTGGGGGSGGVRGVGGLGILNPLPTSAVDFSSSINFFVDFKRTYLFRILFLDSNLLNLLSVAYTTQLVASSSTPYSSTEQISVGWQGSKIKFAGKTDYHNWTVTVRDDYLNIANTYFQKWRDSIYESNTGKSSSILSSGIGLTNNGYKKSAILILMANGDQLLSLTAMRGYLIKGIWPMEIGQSTVDYTNETILTFPITFSIDSYEPYSLTSGITDIVTSLI